MSGNGSTGSHGGTPKSWLAVIVILLGSTLSGVGLTVGPNWLLVWVGVGVCAVGGVLALVFDIMSDVIVDAPRVPLAEADPMVQRVF
ncbi:hypothetical protein SAMN05421505_10235 [Sinosporangium album]|uniref:Uncharacterized protein n=1 Tax=Sinosporangium album TaxID=504805 RepID=A0A1G7RUY3_9ACTN|nr:hypothetical protein SAMN05421505_10235 [Sinosporangium album]